MLIKCAISFFLFFLINFSIFSLPPYISIKERIQECNTIITGNITVIKQRALFEESTTVTLLVEKHRILKNSLNLNIPDSFYMYIHIYPETFENKLKFIPKEGKYIIFLDPIVKNNNIIVYKLYKEEPFALEPWSKEKEDTILLDIKK